MRQLLMVLIVAVVVVGILGAQDKVRKYPYWSDMMYTDTVAYGMMPFQQVSSDKAAEFPVYISADVVTLDRVEIEFRTKPLAVQGYTFPVMPGQSYVTIFSLAQDDDYPIGLRLWLDHVDVSATFGGPWNADDRTSPTIVKADLTELIVQSGTLEHTLKVTCGATELSYWTLALPGDTSHNMQSQSSAGIIEMRVSVRGLAQVE